MCDDILLVLRAAPIQFLPLSLSPSLRRRPRLPAAHARRPHDDITGALVGELDRLLDAADALLARLEEDEEDVVADLEDGHEAAPHAQPHYAANVGHEPSFAGFVFVSIEP